MNDLRILMLALITPLFLAAQAAGQSCAGAGCGYCGDYICDYGEEWCLTDCGSSYCGDYICSPELGEDPYTCTQDCVCGDGVCSSNAESSASCPGDCPPPPTCTADTCSSCLRPTYGINNDYDGIPDQLEHDLAHAFFPAVMIKDVGSDLQEAYLYRGKAIPFTVEALAAQGICNEAYKCLEIRYGMAYRYDHGDSIYSGHLGDSEFYAVLVMRTQPWSTAVGSAASWQMVRDFTAAHWGSPVDSSVYGGYGHCLPNCSAWNYDEVVCRQQAACSFYPGQCYGGMSANYEPCSSFSDEGSCYFSGGSCRWMQSQCFQSEPVSCYSSQPSASHTTLYAAEKKHALYHSDSECDHGGFVWPWGEGEDECPNTNLHSLRNYKGELLQNVGNRYYPAADSTIQHPDWCSLYNVWGGQYFGATTTPYYNHFTTTLRWGLLQ